MMIRYLLKGFILLLLFSFITHNLFSQTFVEQTGISLPGVSNGSVAWGDYDNDSDLDILITGYGSDNKMIVKVFHNNGSDSFTDVGSVFSPTIPNEYGYNRCNALWNDFDNDGYIDILVRGQTDSGDFLNIYRNEGDNTFTLRSTITYLTMGGSSVDCGDYDNDGDQDVLLTTSASTKIYQNKGNFVFNEQTSVTLPGRSYSSSRWGDYDNDGDLDILNAAIFQNQGNNVFIRQDGIWLSDNSGGSSEWGDYNNDGYLDILLAGGGATKLFKNNGNNTFTEQSSIVFKGVNYGTGKWGDIDNDGDLDIIISGDNNGTIITKIYFNNGDNTFTEGTSIVLDGVKESSIDLGDYDNDGDLDVLLSGKKEISKISKIYRNDSSVNNPAPSAPTGLTSVVQGSTIILKWNPVNTDNTSRKTMSYNIMVGTAPGGIDVVAPNSSGTGIREISGMGNGQLDTTFILINLKKGTYYWEVQAVDNCFKGSAFSNEATFIYSASYQAFGLKAPVIGGKEVTLSWSRGNGENCIVFMKEGNTGVALPVNSTSYTSSVIFKSGSPIGASGWYCVYTGTQTSINVTGLNVNSDYIFQVIEFDGNAGSESYNTQTATDNPLAFKTGIFTELRNAVLQPVNYSNYQEQTPSTCWFDFDNDDDLDLLLVGTNASTLYRNDGNDIFTLTSVVLSRGYSAACGDYNNDGFIDILIGFYPSRLYKNNGDGTFSEQTGISLPYSTLGSVAWGDYDNDGYLDIALTGNSDGGRIAKIFRNNGNNTFSEQNLISIPGVALGNSAWGDYDNDGLSDFLLSGITNNGTIAKVYRNTGKNNLKEQTEIILPGSYSLAEWGDYDSDGDLDILLSDLQGSSTKLFRNGGNNSFSEQSGVSMDAVVYGSAAWGDYDNDGDLDILMTGSTGSSQITKLFKNNGDNTFTEDLASSITDVGYSSAAWGDYDNDGDLDIALTGNSEDVPVSKIYRNDITTANIKPAAPEGINSNVNNSEVTLKWNRVRSDISPYKAISYNIKVGTTNGGIDLVSPQSSASGFRRQASIGNCNLDSAYILNKVPVGTYYWSVQAIDNGFAGGPFSEEGIFTIVPVQAKNLAAKILNNNSLSLKWGRGNGDRCVVFCKQTFSGLAGPVNNTSYIADNEFGYGTQIGSTGWYCVYNGRADSVNVTGLIYQKEYNFHVIEYAGTFGSEQYFTQTSEGNPAVFSTSLFTEQTGIPFNNNYNPNPVAWGDYDNDGFLDLLVPGNPSIIYHNNGDNTFTEKTGISLVGVRKGSAAWGDYDNDGDLDFVISGASSGDYNDLVTKIYRNNGSDTFTEETQAILAGVYFSSVVWGDYDNDGNLDILLTGATGSDPVFNPVSKIYRNNGNNTFTEQTQISLTGVLAGSATWGDFDNDGDLDILLSGSIDYPYNSKGIFKIYRNGGNNTFTEQTQIQSPQTSWSFSDWGDFDNDGDLDFLLTTFGSLSIYENSGNDIFTFYESINLWAASGSCYAAWGDYDNDGYLDILLANPQLDSRILKNINGESFNRQDDESLNSAGYGFVSWADYDNDGDLDFILAKGDNPTAIFKNNIIMKSGLFKPNTAPAAPVGLLSTKSPLGVTLKWNTVKNDETLYKTMTYNVRVGTKKDSTDICPPHSAITGFRKIAAIGNAQMDTAFLLKNLAAGKYFWSVQAVDQGYTGGAWSAVDSFTVNFTVPFPPVITSFTPASGPIGTSVTINGTNFSTTASDNIVWFGAVQAAVTAATATQLTVTVPTGATYQPITVTVNGLTDYSTAPFNVTFPSSKIIDATSFALKVDLSTWTSPSRICIGDIDGDGKPDLVVTRNGSDTISVYRNISSSGSITAGSFAARADFITGDNPTGIAIGDIDGDGKLDLVVINNWSNTVSILRNTSTSGSISTGSFAPKVDFITGTNPINVTIGDIDGDGKPDLAVTNSGDNTFSVFRNLSSPGTIVAGSFAPKVDFITGTLTGPWGINIEDIDGDGKPDLLVTNNKSNTISVFRNTSTNGLITASSFAAEVNLITETGPLGIATGDIDGDGKLDLAISNINSNKVSVYRNTSSSGLISFSIKVDFTTGSNPFSVAISDIDGDSKPDLVVTNNGSASVSAFKNTCTPESITTSSFSISVDFTTGNIPEGLSIGDIDGDGKPDLFVANRGSNTVSVLRNTISESIPPVIASFNPTSGPIGTVVTINGTNFSTTTSDNIVWFGAVQATVITAIATQLTVTVPAEATSQPISVTVNGLTASSGMSFTIITPPTISSFSPISGPVGTTVTIEGTNFSTLPADNIVLFGTAQASVISVTATQLSVIVPTGAFTQPITLTVNGLTTFTGTSFTVTVPPSNPPAITSFTPTSGPVGTTVTINGSNFSTNISNNIVKFGTVQAAVISATAAQLAVIVPAGAITQPIYVTVDGLTAYTSTSFNVTFPPVITSFSPTSGPVGTTVTIEGTNFGTIPADNTVLFGTVQASVISATATQLSVVVPTGATTQLISVTVNGLTSNSGTSFTVTAPPSDPPAITSFSPTSGQVGTNITIYGSNFSTNISNNIVKFGTVQAAIISGMTTQLMVTVPAGATTQPIYVTVNSLTAYSSTSFIVISAPVITSFNPISGQVGDTVTIGGTNFSTIPADNIVMFGTVQAMVTAATTTQLTVTVPGGAISQPIAVTVNGLSAISGTSFTVTTPPAIMFFNPTSGPVGTTVMITGSNFSTNISNNIVRFGTVQAAVISATATQLTVIVPAWATSQPIYVTVDGLTTFSIISFNVTSAPVIASFNPNSGPAGTNVTIQGTNFGTAPTDNIVLFGTVQASVISVTATQLSVIVPAGATTQPIAVTANGLTTFSGTSFIVTAPPSEPPFISSFNPTSGPVGCTVIITGSNFSPNGGDNNVRFGNRQADLYNATSTQLTVTVPNGAITNPISVTVNGLTGSSGMPFNVTTQADPPVIGSVNPTSGPVGSSVTINGANFSQNPENNTVMFGDVPATVTGGNQNQITVLVPEGADGQYIRVTVNGLTASSSGMFTVTIPSFIELESSILTLNGDGINESLVFRNFSAYGKSSLYVYNSRGAMVYWNKDFKEEWDLTIHNRRLETGGYFYVIETELGTFKGSFSVLKR